MRVRRDDRNPRNHRGDRPRGMKPRARDAIGQCVRCGASGTVRLVGRTVTESSLPLAGTRHALCGGDIEALDTADALRRTRTA